VPPGAATTDVWLNTRLEELAKDLGRLRRGTRDTQYEWETDRLADRVWWLICRDTPTAADLVKEGASVDSALGAAEQETRRLKLLLGERP
jgi:hypothetical protein